MISKSGVRNFEEISPLIVIFYSIFFFFFFFFKELENLSVEKKTLSTALGFEPRSFDCRSI